jgi:putative transposase
MSSKYKFRNQDKLYFVSFATIYWLDVFIRNEYKEIVLDSLRVCQEKKGLEVYSWVIMTSHVHLIIGTHGEKLERILGSMKTITSRKLKESIKNNPKESRKEWMLWMMKRAGEKNSNNKDFQFWDQDNHPIELFDNVIMQQKLEYIHNNPVEAGFVSKAEDWLWSSAIDYAGGKGKLKIKLIE